MMRQTDIMKRQDAIIGQRAKLLAFVTHVQDLNQGQRNVPWYLTFIVVNSGTKGALHYKIAVQVRGASLRPYYTSYGWSEMRGSNPTILERDCHDPHSLVTPT
jgi:hypothetical protein